MSNLVIRGSWFKDGSDYVVILTGQPQDSVKIGVGETVAEAWDNLQATPIQSVGRDSGEAEAIRWAVGAGWVHDYVTIEEMPDHLRESHRKAGNWGSYPQNGATRRVVTREEAEEIEAEDEYNHIVKSVPLEREADDEAADSVTEPVGDLKWSEYVCFYVSAVYGATGDEPGDCYVRVGEDELGLWWIDDGDAAVRQDIEGPFNTEAEACNAAEELVSERHEGEPGEDAEAVTTRLLEEAAGEPDANGEWSLYWETVGDDSCIVERYGSEGAALAAAALAQNQLEIKNPGGNRLCSYGVRQLIDGEWVGVT
jgi:hypothetical protein